MRAIVISLKDSKRRAFLKQNFGDVEIFDAVHGVSEIQEQEDELIVRGDIRIPLDRALSQATRGKQLGKGQLGCAVSHFLLWKALAESSEPAFLIMEDDARIHRPQFELAMRNLPAPADIIYLQDQDLRSNAPPRERSRYNDFFYRTEGGVAGAIAYILYRDYARTLVNGFRMAHGADGALGRSFRERPEVRVYYMYEPCVCLTELNDVSDIGNIAAITR
ncbi:MAG: glycosyltransferase family 25 protein [Arenimonas sp.]|nr:glycosyltransferase family 25 protein [Arenimonas sp.]